MQRETVRKLTEVVGDKHLYTIVSRRCLQQIEAKTEELLRPSVAPSLKDGDQT